MNLKIYAGQRVLFKENGQWHVGNIAAGEAKVNEHGLYLPIFDKNANLIFAEFNEVFFNGFKLEDWVHDYSEYFMTKDEYIEFMQQEDFDARQENAYVSDGEYAYYPIAKYNKNWIEKQPFDYITRFLQ